MMELNILRKRQDQFRRKLLLIRLFLVYFGGLFLILLILGISFLANSSMIPRIKTRIDGYNTKIRNEQTLVNQLEQYRGEMDAMSGKLAAGQKELDKIIPWTHKMYIISSSLPTGVWLTKFVMQPSQIKNEATDSSKVKGKIASETFVIEGGISASSGNETRLLAQFMNNLKKNADTGFVSFSLKEVRREQRTGGNQDIVSFRIECGVRKVEQ